MCGRFAFHSPHETTAQLFGVADSFPSFPPRWNVAPGTDIAVVRIAADGKREIVALRWGLVPSWAKERSIGQRLVNARAETLAEKPAFRSAFRKRRCLIPADGYYEWRIVAGGKQPYYVQPLAGQLFALAGLWERWVDPASGEALETCVILTREAAGIVREIHGRMPVIIPPEAFAHWLDPAADAPATLAPFLGAAADAGVEAHPVSRRVNSPRNDGAELTAAVLAEAPGAA